MWEYRVVELEGNFGPGSLTGTPEVLRRQLNHLGEEGWELAGILPSAYRRNAEEHRREVTSALLCFKREKNPERAQG